MTVPQVIVTVYMPAAMAQDLRVAAKAGDRSFSAEVRRACTAHLGAKPVKDAA